MNSDDRSRSFILSSLGGLTLLALAVAVFSVAVTARSVSTGAEETVELVESLRVISLSRSELSSASRLAELTPDDQAAIEAAIANSVDAITATRTVIEEHDDADLIAAFDAYVRAAEDQSALLLEPDRNENATLLAEATTGSTFDAVANQLRARQEATLRELGADNDFMNTIGTVATFIVAFVVPSAALYIFEALRRSPRRTRELDLRTARLEARANAAAMALQREVATLRIQIFGAGSTTDEQRRENIRRSLLRLDNLAMVNGAIHQWQRKDVDLVAIANEVLASVPPDQSFTVDASAAMRTAIGDPVQIALITHELVRNAFNHGTRPVAVTVGDDGDESVTITVSDHGSGLTAVIESAVLLERDYALRNNLANGRFGFGLLAARMAAQSMGARLQYAHEDGITSMTLELPAGEGRVAATAPPEELRPAA